MKAYLLLRNNQQSGPYSLSELQQMGLQPFDLVWIEKKSNAWRYPSEIKELIAFVAASKKINSLSNTQYTNSKVISISTISSLVNTDTEPISEQYTNHLAALKSTEDDMQDCSIKPSNTSKNILQVKVRNGIVETKQTTSFNNAEKPANAAYIINDNAAQNDIVKSSSTVSNQYISHNRLEWVVLIIAAVSLLAVMYLLISSPY